MTDKETIHKILSSLWKNDNSVGKMCYNQALQDAQTAFDTLPEEPVSEDLEEAVHEYIQHIPESEPELMNTFYTWEQMEAAFKAGAKWNFEKIEEVLLSEVLPYFMHGGEADEVVAKLEEVLLNQKK